MNFEQTDEFKKELKAFSKKWRSLPDDLEKLMLVLPALYPERRDAEFDNFRESFFANKKAAVIKITLQDAEAVKIRLDCRSLGNKSILRVIYIRNRHTITFVELYSKNEKAREDSKRLQSYLE